LHEREYIETVIDKPLKGFNLKEIIVHSRDQKKQFNMRNKCKDDRLRFVIGNMRDRGNVFRAMNNVDCEFERRYKQTCSGQNH
jgi:FlaA1/EpsC-like NDP-sugar epimerase